MNKRTLEEVEAGLAKVTPTLPKTKKVRPRRYTFDTPRPDMLKIMLKLFKGMDPKRRFKAYHRVERHDLKAAEKMSTVGTPFEPIIDRLRELGYYIKSQTLGPLMGYPFVFHIKTDIDYLGCACLSEGHLGEKYGFREWTENGREDFITAAQMVNRVELLRYHYNSLDG